MLVEPGRGHQRYQHEEDARCRGSQRDEASPSLERRATSISRHNPVDEQAAEYGGRQVDEDQVAALETGLAEQGYVKEQVAQRGEASPRCHQAEGREEHEEPDVALATQRPSTEEACDGGSDARHPEQAEIPTHLGQVVIDEVAGLVQQSDAPEEVGDHEQRRLRERD